MNLHNKSLKKGKGYLKDPKKLQFIKVQLTWPKNTLKDNNSLGIKREIGFEYH